MNSVPYLRVTVCALLTAFAFLLLVAAAVVLNKAGGVDGLASSRTLLGASAALLCGGCALAATCFLAFRKSACAERRSMRLSIGAAVLASSLLLIGAEAFLRRAAVPTELSARVGAVELLPFDWDQARRTSRQWLERTRSEHAVLDVEDADLGWDLGRGRRSADGMYATSTEGVRSANPATAFAPQHARYRIALIGDSFTFGEEATFEDTWGRRLEQMLPDGGQVLNFGVPSHGLDQTLLKFRRDVRGWNPDVTVLSFLNASPLRNANVYLVLRPDQRLPFTKPRFVLNDGALQLLNSPVLSAEAMLASASIRNLPWLEHDSRFLASQWTASPLNDSYVARWLFSRFPRWPPPDTGPSAKDVADLATRIIEQLIADIRAAGSHVLIVSLPVKGDLAGGLTPWSDAVVRQLAYTGVDVLDIAPCLLQQLPTIDEAFVQRESAGSPMGVHINEGAAHYSPRGNAAVAACLQPIVSQLLDPPPAERQPLSSSAPEAVSARS